MTEAEYKKLAEFLKAKGITEIPENILEIPKNKKIGRPATRSNAAMLEALWMSVEPEVLKHPTNDVSVASLIIAEKGFLILSSDNKKELQKFTKSKKDAETIRRWYYAAIEKSKEDNEEGRHLARRMKLLTYHFKNKDKNTKEFLERLKGKP